MFQVMKTESSILISKPAWNYTNTDKNVLLVVVVFVGLPPLMPQCISEEKLY